MLFRSAVFSFLLLCAACGSAPQEFTFSKGMSREEFLKAAKQAGAIDITGGLQLENNGDLKELYWEFKPYQLVVLSDFKENKLNQLRVWTTEAFSTPRGLRHEQGVDKTTLRLSSARKTYTSE